MLAGLHRCHRDHRVSVVGRGDEQLRRVVLLEVEARLRQFAAEAPASPEKRAGSVCRFHAVFARLCGTTQRQYRARLRGNGAPPMQAEEGDLPKNVRANLSATRSLLQESKPVSQGSAHHSARGGTAHQRFDLLAADKVEIPLHGVSEA